MTTTEEAPALLADMMRERPNDFDFSDVADPGPAGLPAGTRTFTLREMLGEFELVKRDPVTGQKFYGRKPKLSGLRKLLELADAPIELDGPGLTAISSMIDRLCAVGALVLYVQEGGGWRPARVEEIGDAFEMAELREVTDRFSGLRPVEGDEGNAPSAPTMP